jgi:hypothetical protein
MAPVIYSSYFLRTFNEDSFLIKRGIEIDEDIADEDEDGRSI